MRALITVFVLGMASIVAAACGETSQASSDGREPGEVRSTVGPSDIPSLPPGPSATEIARGSSAPPIRPAPQATLQTSGGSKVVGGAGTRCWGGMCLDYIGPVTNSSPVALPANESFSVTFEQGAPTERAEGWVRVDGKKPSTVASDGAAWSMEMSFVRAVEPGAERPALTPGQYIYVVQGFWHNQGDVMYGFWIELR